MVVTFILCLRLVSTGIYDFFFIVSYCFVAPLIKSHLLKMEASLLVTLFAIEKACVIFNKKKHQQWLSSIQVSL